MSTHIIRSLQKNNRIATWFLGFCFAILSVYPIYRNFYYSNGLLTFERHKAIIERRSEYYNPWQYRILCPYTIEALLFMYNATLDKVLPVEKKFHFSITDTSGSTEETSQFVKIMQTPGAIKYMIIFILFRLVEHLFIFFLAWKLWAFFVKSKWLIFFGVNFLAIALGNAVTVADLSFNTYMDIIFYLVTANVIVYKKNPLILVPITLLAAFNRETGILIPALYFISQTDFKKFIPNWFNIKLVVFPTAKTWFFTMGLYLIFLVTFIGLRMHFGYKPQQVWKVPSGWPMLKLNLFSAVGVKGFMELIGTYALIPLIIIYRFKSFPYLLKKWFVFIVPVWFAVHYLSVVAYQTRLFMVPFIIIMMPMLLWLLEKEVIQTSVEEQLT